MKRTLALIAVLLAAACSSDKAKPAEDIQADERTPDAGVDGILDVITPDVPGKDTHDVAPPPDISDVPDVSDVPDTQIPDETDPPDLVLVHQHMDKGKYWLSVAEPVFALREYQKAIDLSPIPLQEAYFGAGLARFISAGELVGMILSLPAQLAGYNSGDGTKKFLIANSESEYIMQTLRQAFSDLRGTFLEADAYFAKVQEIDETLFEISGAPMYFTVRPIVVFRGKFDLGDLYLFRSATAFGLWATGLLSAQNFNTDLGVLLDTVKHLDDGVDLFAILGTLSYLMSVNPSFLALDGETGQQVFEEGAKNMKDAGKFLVQAIDFQEAHPDQGQDEVTWYDQSGSTLIIKFSNKVLAKDLSEKVISLKFSEGLIADMRALLQAMETPDAVVPWSKGPAIQLGTAIALLQAMGIMDYIPIDLPVDISSFGPDQLVGLLRTLLSDAFGFNYTAFFASPAGLRSFLPIFSEKIDGVDRFLVEWECPEELAANGGKPLGKGDLACSDAAALTDLAHFEGTPYELAADGVTTPLPYLVFGDPTWSNFLRVAEGVGTETPGPGWLVPDNDLMNKGLHEFMKGLAPLLQ